MIERRIVVAKSHFEMLGLAPPMASRPMALHVAPRPVASTPTRTPAPRAVAPIVPKKEPSPMTAAHTDRIARDLAWLKSKERASAQMPGDEDDAEQRRKEYRKSLLAIIYDEDVPDDEKQKAQKALRILDNVEGGDDDEATKNRKDAEAKAWARLSPHEREVVARLDRKPSSSPRAVTRGAVTTMPASMTPAQARARVAELEKLQKAGR